MNTDPPRRGEKCQHTRVQMSVRGAATLPWLSPAEMLFWQTFCKIKPPILQRNFPFPHIFPRSAKIRVIKIYRFKSSYGPMWSGISMEMTIFFIRRWCAETLRVGGGSAEKPRPTHFASTHGQAPIVVSHFAQFRGIPRTVSWGSDDQIGLGMG